MTRRRPRRGVWPDPSGRPGTVQDRMADISRSGAWHPKGPRFERIKSGFLALHHYRCGLCGCYGGPTSGLAIDHIIPLSECAVHVPPIDPMDTRNWQPAHHSKPCPFCSELAGRPIRCNQLRNNLSVQAARQKIANLVGKPVMGIVPATGKQPREFPAPVRGEREWV